MRQEQYYDKILDRMQKLEVSINRAVRSLDRIAEALEAEPETPLDRAMRQARSMTDAEILFGGIEAIPTRPAEADEAEEWNGIHR